MKVLYSWIKGSLRACTDNINGFLYQIFHLSKHFTFSFSSSISANTQQFSKAKLLIEILQGCFLPVSPLGWFYGDYDVLLCLFYCGMICPVWHNKYSSSDMSHTHKHANAQHGGLNDEFTAILHLTFILLDSVTCVIWPNECS